MPEPIVTRLPDTQRAVENKYAENPYLIDPNSPISRALLALDVDRSRRGQNPLSVRQHTLALKALQTNQTPIPSPDRGIFKDLVSDVTTLAASIPRLPAALYQEAKALPTIPSELSKAMDVEGGLLSQLSAVAQVPGVRLLPGAFIAQNLQTPGELANHPLFTLLDVLPAKNIPVVKGATNKLATQVKGSLPYQEAATTLRTSKPGAWVSEAFGKQARDVAQLQSQFSEHYPKAMFREKMQSDPLINLAQRTQQFPAKWAKQDIPLDRQNELLRLGQTDADTIRQLPAKELSFINEYRTMQNEWGDYATREGLLDKIDGEYYVKEDAKRILRSRTKVNMAKDYAQARSTILNPTGTVDDILDSMRGVLRREDLKTGTKLELLQGYAHGIESLGFDAAEIFATIKSNRKGGAYNPDNIATSLDDYSPNPIATSPLSDAIQTLTPLARTDTRVGILLDHVKSGRWKEAKTLAKRVSTRRKFTVPDIESVVDRAGREAQKERYLRTTAGFNEKKVSKLETQAKKIEERVAPARFQPKLADEINKKLTVQLSDDPRFDEILPYLQERNYGWLAKEGLLPTNELRAIEREITSGWKELKDAGYDPIFVHRVWEGQLGSIQAPRVLERVPTPSSVRKRVMDVTPALDDISVALPHQALGFLQRKGSEEFVAAMMDRFAKDSQDVLDTYTPAARRLARSPEEVLQIADQMMRKEWQEYNPKDIITWASPRISAYGESKLVPKSVANTIQRMHTPPGGRLTAALDPVMNLFRTSILPFSPRFHLYNIVGGGIVLTGQTGPDVWKYLNQARQMVKAGEMPEQLPHGMGMVPSEFRELASSYTKRTALPKRLEAIFHHAGGRTQGRLWEEIQNAKVAVGKAADWSYDKNAIVDDIYRTMAFLYGRDKALTKGMTREAAEQAGEELTRKTLQNWDRMTPIERQIIRQVFPFYGWMQHIIRYSLKYPVDHPFRVAVMSSFSRNELDDLGTALPEKFLNTFFLGDMDKDGNVTGLNIAGMNPFRDVANYFTLSGFLGSTNPIITSILQSVGVDPVSGGPELFPTLRYDPEQGRLTVQSKNPILNFVQATVPPSRILFGMLDSSSEFQALLRANPDAARRLLLSQAGLPILFRDINVPQEVAKSTIAKEEDQSMVLNEALKSGDWSEAEKYPQLQPVLAKIKTLQKSGALEQYEPQSPGQNAIGMAQEALRKNFVP